MCQTPPLPIIRRGGIHREHMNCFWLPRLKRGSCIKHRGYLNKCDKNGHLLAFLTKPTPNPITSFQIYDNAILQSSHEQIMDSFQKCNSNQYMSQAHYIPPELYEYAEAIAFHNLTPTEGRP